MCSRLPRDTPDLPVLEPLLDIYHLPCHQPNITAVQYHRLRYRLIHHTTGPYRSSHLRQHSHNHPPPPLHFLQVLIHRLPTDVFIGYLPPKVMEGLQR